MGTHKTSGSPAHGSSGGITYLLLGHLMGEGADPFCLFARPSQKPARKTKLKTQKRRKGNGNKQRTEQDGVSGGLNDSEL